MLTKCSECGHELSTTAEHCPNCGAPVKSPAVSPPPPPPPPPPQPDSVSATKPASRKKWWFLGCGCLALLVIVVAAVLVGVVGGFSFLASILPGAKIENLTMSGDTRVINDEFDWGENVAFDLNSYTSDPKDFTVEIRLSCSEGEWSRRETVHLAPNESRHLTVFFQEPTVKAENIKARVELVR